MEREKHSISLLFYVVGIVGNVTSCIVWSGHVRQMGGARFLLALSVSDSITIVSLATYSVLELLHKYCSAYIFVYLGDSFYCLSSYITIAVVAQRYISIAFPFSVSRLCSNVRTRVTLILLVATAALQNVGYAKFTTTRYLFCVDTNRTQEEVAAMQADEVDMVYVYFALNFLPLLPLVLFNSLLLRALWKMKQIACADANRSHERAKLKVSVMAVCVSSTTILTYCASQTVNFYVIMNYDLTTASLTASYDEHVANALGFVREVCVAFTVSVNVFFYSCFSDNFRSTIRGWWRRVAGKSERGIDFSRGQQPAVQTESF